MIDIIIIIRKRSNISFAYDYDYDYDYGYGRYVASGNQASVHKVIYLNQRTTL